MSRELTCQEAEPLHLDRSSGVEVGREASDALDRHLETCESCQAFVEEIADMDRRVVAAVREDLEAHDPERDARDMALIRAAVDAREEELTSVPDAASAIPGYTLRALLGAIALAAAVFFAAGLGVRHQAPDPGGGIPTLGFQEQLRELESERDEARAAKEASDRERDEARRERDEARAGEKASERERDEARRERDETRRERDEARRERDEARARIEELERQLEEARKE